MDTHQSNVPHDWRELAREIGIIVVGVLIALFFGQIVDSAQWASKVRAAERAMRWELLWDDGPQVYQRAAMHPCLMQRLNEIRTAVQHDDPRQQIAALTVSYSLDWLTYDSVAEQQELASDVSSHMPQQEMEDFATAYSQIPVMDRIAEREDYDIGQLHGFNRSGGQLTSTEKEKLLSTVAALRTDDSEMFYQRIPRER